MGLIDATHTTTALLDALREPGNDDAWRELCGRMIPIMRAVAFRMGALDADVGDLVQTTLVTFLEAWRHGQYDRTRGRLSTYLLTILRSRVIELQRRHARRAGMRGESALVEAPSAGEAERCWMDERQRVLFATALDRLRAQGVEERLLQAFDLYALRGVNAAEVGSRLGMTREDVYDAKYRVTRRLRPIVARLDELYEDL
ncbi:MAG: sigma-70 family RNA polymerase sigma factor [Phycisphaerales bacterium]|jgi:RNA polymerase sigma factor (sigma-70 family)